MKMGYSGEKLSWSFDHGQQMLLSQLAPAVSSWSLGYWVPTLLCLVLLFTRRCLLQTQIQPVNSILDPITHISAGQSGTYPVNALIGRTLLSRALKASAILVNPACWISSTLREFGKSCLFASIRTGISAVS